VDQRKAEELIRKLLKRGFKRDSVKDHCPACNVSALHVYQVASRLGGRDVKWCMACGKINSFKRTANGDLNEDIGFDLEQFLA
jgi:hypothetical protein